MARAAEVESIESQITHYISSLSDKNKQAVLTVVKTIAEAERETEFERKWKNGVPLKKARQELLEHVRSFEWKKKK